jgi:uncharacterized membrane protein YkvA (DUF1232 family)
MTGLLKIIFVVILILYIINPFDISPDAIPILGWIDDILLMGVLFYYLRKGRLPGFLLRFSNLFKTKKHYYRNHENTDSRKDDEKDSNSKPESETQIDNDPYEILKIKPGASMEEIHTAYRKVAQAYHPDKVSHLGKEFQELAQKKFIKINEAYEKLTKS